MSREKRAKREPTLVIGEIQLASPTQSWTVSEMGRVGEEKEEEACHYVNFVRDDGKTLPISLRAEQSRAAGGGVRNARHPSSSSVPWQVRKKVWKTAAPFVRLAPLGLPLLEHSKQEHTSISVFLLPPSSFNPISIDHLLTPSLLPYSYSNASENAGGAT